MDQAFEEWLEKEYSDFERKFAVPGRFWRVPARNLNGTPLEVLFKEFERFFPDHPTEINTVVYLFETVQTQPLMRSVWLWCSHFEHSSIDDVRDLVAFMETSRHILGTREGCSSVEMLDNFRENIILSFSDPQQAMVELLKSLGVEGGSSMTPGSSTA